MPITTTHDGNVGAPGHDTAPEKPLTFAEHRDTTAADCDALAKLIANLAGKIRDGDVKAFERFFIEGGTEEGDAQVCALRERLVLRYLHREDRLG